MIPSGDRWTKTCPKSSLATFTVDREKKVLGSLILEPVVGWQFSVPWKDLKIHFSLTTENRQLTTDSTEFSFHHAADLAHVGFTFDLGGQEAHDFTHILRARGAGGLNRLVQKLRQLGVG